MDFWHVLAVLVDVVLVLDQLVAHLLFEVGTLRTEPRHAINHVLHQVETIQLVLAPGGRYTRTMSAFLLIT